MWSSIEKVPWRGLVAAQISEPGCHVPSMPDSVAIVCCVGKVFMTVLRAKYEQLRNDICFQLTRTCEMVVLWCRKWPLDKVSVAEYLREVNRRFIGRKQGQLLFLCLQSFINKCLTGVASHAWKVLLLNSSAHLWLLSNQCSSNNRLLWFPRELPAS